MRLGELGDEADAVNTRADFVSFVKRLLAVYGDRPDWWENVDLPSFLEVLAAWVDGMDSGYKNRGEILPDQPTWRVVADMLLAAAIYE